MKEIEDIFKENKQRYGVRRVYRELINRGYQINHKRVQRLMHEAELKGKRPKEKYNSYKGEARKSSRKHNKQRFQYNSTVTKMDRGKCYLSAILDMNTNEIISYELSLHPTLNQVKRMLDKAIEKFPNVKGIILHSDQGWQYQHRDYRDIEITEKNQKKKE